MNVQLAIALCGLTGHYSAAGKLRCVDSIKACIVDEEKRADEAQERQRHTFRADERGCVNYQQYQPTPVPVNGSGLAISTMQAVRVCGHKPGDQVYVKEAEAGVPVWFYSTGVEAVPDDGYVDCYKKWLKEVGDL
jgi:hypothetical protein